MAQLDKGWFQSNGLESETCDKWLQQFSKWTEMSSAVDVWHRFQSELFEPKHSRIAYAIYQRLFSHRDPEQGPAPCWQPGPKELESSNIAKAMRALELSSYTEFHRWSIEDRQRFWQWTMDKLQIRFHKQPQSVLDDSAGPTHPRWLPGAELNIVESCFLADPTSKAIVFQNRDGSLTSWTYADLDTCSNQVAWGLKDLGLRTGDAVAIDMPMTAESVAIYLGILKLGGVVISVADSFSPPEIATRLRIGQAAAVFTQDVILRNDKKLPMYQKVLEAKPPTTIVLPAEDQVQVDLRTGDMNWTDFLGRCEPFPVQSRTPHDHINILFSSGTTGDPKAIPWNHTTAIKAASDGYFHQDICQGDVVVWPTNLGWMMGPWLIFASLINRATIGLYYEAPTSAAFLRFCQRIEVTMLGLVPSLVKAWLKNGALNDLKLDRLKCFSSTGECANMADMFALMAAVRFRPVIEYCGGTEIGGGYLTGSLVQPASPATFSTPALGLDLVVLDEMGDECTRGEVFLVPPSMGLSVELLNRDHEKTYYDQTPRLEGYPILRRHGDEVEKLGAGYYRAMGRSDDTMNLGGIKTSSAELERIMLVLDEVIETAAIAVSPQGGPSQLVYYVVASRKPASDLLQRMQAQIKNELNPLFKIHDLVLVPDLPRTASGKVMRRVLRDRYEQSQ